MEESKLKVKCQMCGDEWLWGIANDENREAFICNKCINEKDIHVNEPLFIVKVIIPNKKSKEFKTQHINDIFKFILNSIKEENK